MSDILPCEGRSKEACETEASPVNEKCVFEFGVCNSVKKDPQTGQDVYEVTIPADPETISDKSTILKSSLDNDVCGYAVLGLLGSAELDGLPPIPDTDPAAAPAAAPATDPATAAGPATGPATGTAAGTVRTIEVKKLPEGLEKCPESPTCSQKRMTKEQLAILLSLFAQIKTLYPSLKPLTAQQLEKIKRSNADGEISWYQYILDELKKKKNGSNSNLVEEEVKYTVKFVDDDEGSTSDDLAESIIKKIAGCPDEARGGKRKRSRRGKKQKKSKRSTRKKRKRKSKKNNIGIN